MSLVTLAGAQIDAIVVSHHYVAPRTAAGKTKTEILRRLVRGPYPLLTGIEGQVRSTAPTGQAADLGCCAR